MKGWWNGSVTHHSSPSFFRIVTDSKQTESENFWHVFFCCGRDLNFRWKQYRETPSKPFCYATSPNDTSTCAQCDCEYIWWYTEAKGNRTSSNFLVNWTAGHVYTDVPNLPALALTSSPKRDGIHSAPQFHATYTPRCIRFNPWQTCPTIFTPSEK